MYDDYKKTFHYEAIHKTEDLLRLSFIGSIRRADRGWAETKQFLFILKIYNNDKYPKQNQIGAKYVSTLYSTAKYQIKVF